MDVLFKKSLNYPYIIIQSSRKSQNVSFVSEHCLLDKNNLMMV